MLFYPLTHLYGPQEIICITEHGSWGTGRVLLDVLGVESQERCEQRSLQAPAHQVSVEVCREACGEQLMSVVEELCWGSGDFTHSSYSN